MQKEKLKTQKGITLIALVITIIVMLILVAVSVTVALRGGLFSAAKQAATGTELRKEEELALSNGQVTIGNTTYTSIASYLGTEPNAEGYSIGQEVTVGGEQFFVIAVNDETVTLLAKYCLNQEGTAQVNAPNSETACRVTGSDLYPGDLTPINTKAETYGAALGGYGRNLTSNEYNALRNANYSGMINGTNIGAVDGYLQYFINDSWDNGFGAWYVTSSGTIYFGYDVSCGVRPVVEISKASLQ